MKNKSRKRKRLFNQKSSKDEAVQLAPEEEDSSDEDDDMPPLIPADGWEPCLGAVDQVTQVPSGAVCQLTGAMMSDPLRTPAGHLIERAALEDWMTITETCPLTGTPLTIDQCQPAQEIKDYIQGYQMQMIAAAEVRPDLFEQPATETTAQAAATGRGSLLGDLPDLSNANAAATKPAKEQKEKNKIRIASRSVVECPEDMRCAIDGKVCINPVRSPYGHLFEKKTLERWFQNCGSVCPVTSKPLRLEECQTDGEMKKRIVKFLKHQDSQDF